MIYFDKKNDIVLGMNIIGKAMITNILFIEMEGFNTKKTNTIGISNQKRSNIHLASIIVNSLNI